MTSDTPESSSSEQPAEFTSPAPQSWAQPMPDSWAATEPGPPEPTTATSDAWPGQATQEPQLPEPDATPTTPWPQPGQPAPSGQVPPGSFQPGHYPPGPFQPGQYPTGQYPAGPYGYPPQFYVPVMPRNNPFAITALVCGLVQFVLGLAVVGNIVAAVPAIVFGSIALKQIRLRGERGRGMAIAGLVLGILGVVYFALIIVLIIVGSHTGNSGTS